jgi:hypothetical protein
MLNLDNIFNKFYPKSQTSGTGKKLYIMAWAIEIFIALVGLTMAYIFYKKAGIDADSVGASSNSSDGIIVALSFVVVAIMEITKIPLATALYYAGKIRWRILFLAALIFVNFSTFETMVQGFDTFYNERIKKVNVVRIQKEALEGQIINLVKKKDLGTTNSEKIKTIQEKLSEYDNQIADLEKRAAESIANTEKQSASANPRIATIQEEINNYLTEIKDKQKLIADILLSAKDAKAGILETYAAAQERAAAPAKQIEEEIKQIKQLIVSKRDEQQKLQGQGASQSKPLIENTMVQKKIDIDQINNLKRNIIENELRPLQLEQNKLAQNEKNYNDEQTKLNDELEKKKDQLRNVASDNQIYRFALKIKVLTIWWNSWGLFSNTADENIKKEIINLEKALEKLSNENLKKIIEIEKNISDAGTDLAKVERLKNNLKLNEINFSKNISRIERQIEDANRNLSNIMAVSLGGSIDESDLTQSDISAAFWLWFGTLSVVISIIGTLIALASLHLQDERMHEIRNRPLKHSFSKFLKRLNGLVLLLARHVFRSSQNLLKPKIVDKIIEKEVVIEKIVEKPVYEEKIVYQRIEIPKETIKKEIVHVPLWTQDPDLLKKKFDPVSYEENKKKK